MRVNDECPVCWTPGRNARGQRVYIYRCSRCGGCYACEHRWNGARWLCRDKVWRDLIVDEGVSFQQDQVIVELNRP